MQVKIIKEWGQAYTDITNYVSPNFTYQSRADEVFATGNMQAIFDDGTFNKNIPPYRVLSVNGKQFLCYSEIVPVLSETTTYTHNFTLLEPTAILSCFNIGTKAFTNKYDVTIINQLLVLARQNASDWSFIFNQDSIFNTKRTYTFGAGYTLYDCLSEIAKMNNMRVEVSSIDSLRKITINFVKLESTIDFTYDTNDVIYKKSTQSANDYCYYLESEATNVVDRNTYVEWRGLTSRSSNSRMTDKSCVIPLPTRVEEIKEFGIQGQGFFFQKCKLYLQKSIAFATLSGYHNLTKTFSEWKSILSAYGYYLGDVFDEFLSIRFEAEQDIFDVPFKLLFEQGYNGDADGRYYLYTDLNINTSSSTNTFTCAKYNMTSLLLEQNVWSMQTEFYKAQHPFYKSGGNTIENLSSQYNYDFWHVIGGNNYSQGFLQDMIPIVDKGNVNGNTCSMQTCANFSYSTDNYYSLMFYVKAVAIVNPKIIDEKTDRAFNESNYEKFSRTYSVKSQSFNDFDRLAKSIRSKNNNLGIVEHEFEIDVTNMTNLPKATQRTLFAGNYYRINSVVYTFGFEKVTAMVYLSKYIDKVAEAIGVPTEFNATPLPMNNIVERPIHMFANVPLTTQPVWAKIRVLGNSFDGTFLKRCVVMDSPQKRIVYFEADDHYSIGSSVDYDDSSNRDYVKDVPYVDSFNECSSIYITLYKQNSVTFDNVTSLYFPKMKKVNGQWYCDWYSNVFTKIMDEKSCFVYKDAREKLTFTIETTKTDY